MQDDLAALIRRNTVAGGFANTVAIAEEAFARGERVKTEPWANFHGDLPDYDHPRRSVFESGVQYTVELLAKELKVNDWTPCDGTEEYDGDLGGTLMNIVLAAMPKDEHGDSVHPRDLPLAFAAPTAGEREPVAWRWRFEKAAIAGDFWKYTEAFPLNAGSPDKVDWGKCEKIVEPLYTSHPIPADREAIARALCDVSEPRLIARQEHAPSYDESRAKVQKYWLSLADTRLPLAAPPNYPDRTTLVRTIVRNTGCSEKCAGDAADAILSMEPLASPPTPSAGRDGSGGEVPTLTREAIMAARTPAGGWTKKTLAGWGISWPPEKGWIARLTGEITPEPGELSAALRLAKGHIEHMAAWISAHQAGYSFEALGEDLPTITSALESLPAVDGS